jgi:hypothetical protein
LETDYLPGGAMKAKPVTMLLAMLAGWINQEQQQIIE